MDTTLITKLKTIIVNTKKYNPHSDYIFLYFFLIPPTGTLQYKFAKKYGQVEETPKPVVFYFETKKASV